MGIVELIQQKAFLGKEFLTWMWFRSEAGKKIVPAGAEAIEIEILGPIVLDASYGDARVTTLKGESPTTSPEARAALIEGKKLKRAKINFKQGDGEWTATLDGENFNLSGLNVPNAGRLPFDEVVALRMEFIREFEETLVPLFETFLDLRLDAKRWGKELKKIHEWVREK